MKVTILHGENTVLSRSRLVQIKSVLKKRGWNFTKIDLKENNLSSQMISQDLFGNQTLFIYENGIANFDKKAFKYLDDHSGDDINLLIWEKKPLTKTQLNKFKDANIELFSIPKEVFNFLEIIYPNNSKLILEKLNKLIETEALEFVFAMMARHLRDLYWVKVAPESLSLPPWRKSKLQSQSGKFSVKQLEKVIKKMAEADVKAKKSEQDLKLSLDLIIIGELK